MGLGPNGSSLFRRLGRSEAPPEEDFWIELEQEDRSSARELSRIAYFSRHKKPPKPLAPVEQVDKKTEGVRVWRWTGETIVSKGLIQGELYWGTFLREMGFKLPPLKKKEKK